MNIRDQNWWAKTVVTCGTLSNTVAGMVSGYRWHLNSAVFSWIGATACSTFTLYEIDDTNSAVFFRFCATTSCGYANFYFGGAEASATNTRLMFDTGLASCTICAAFTGY